MYDISKNDATVAPQTPFYAPVECDASLSRGQYSCRPIVEDGHKEISTVSSSPQSLSNSNIHDQVVSSRYATRDNGSLSSQRRSLEIWSYLPENSGLTSDDQPRALPS